jgi:hypothetical protein
MMVSTVVAALAALAAIAISIATIPMIEAHMVYRVLIGMVLTFLCGTAAGAVIMTGVLT